MVVNKALIDYITLSSYDMDTMKRLWKESPLCSATEEQKRMQYTGLVNYSREGSWFIGWGKQKGKDHCIIQVSGQASEHMFRLAKDDIIKKLVTVTRIDVQRTIEEPVGWSSRELNIMCEEKGLEPKVQRSKGLNGSDLITVYTGSRASGRMNRTYQKETIEGERFVRFETEFGRHYSKAVAYRIATGKESRQSFINGEVKRREVVSMFSHFIAGEDRYDPIPNEKKESSKTEKWIIEIVLPALVRYKNSHSSNHELIKTILKALQE